MTDRNSDAVTPANWVRAVPDGQDEEKYIIVTSVTYSGQRNDVLCIDSEDPGLQAHLAGNGFQGQGGTFGGGGASGSW